MIGPSLGGMPSSYVEANELSEIANFSVGSEKGPWFGVFLALIAA